MEWECIWNDQKELCIINFKMMFDAGAVKLAAVGRAFHGHCNTTS